MEKERSELAARIDVAYVARLARLELTEEERATFQRQLDEILGYVRKIGELDVAGIEPASHGLVVCNVFRRDEPRPGLDAETVLRNAPARLGDQFQVPKIVE